MLYVTHLDIRPEYHPQKFSNVDMLSPLILHMTMHDPAERPSADEALKRFREISQGVWTVHRLWRARLRDESLIESSLWDAVSLVCTINSQ